MSMVAFPLALDTSRPRAEKPDSEHLGKKTQSASTPRVLVFRPIFPDTSSTSDETDQK